MWITKHRNVILLLAASSALFGQSNDFLVKSQSYSNTLEVRQIVESSIAATERSWQRRLQYTYVERDEDRRLDPEGRVKSVEVDVSRTILVNGIPFEQLLEHNGQPPPATEERKQREKLESLRRNLQRSGPSGYVTRRRRPRRSSGRYPEPSIFDSWAKR